MKVELKDIPGVDWDPNPEWNVKVLSVNGKSPALDALLRWKREENRDYRKIIAAIKIAAQNHRVSDQKRVKKSTNPKHGNVYEFRADKLHARLLFFYDDAGHLIICTNDYWKNSGNQDTAFAHCAALKELYERNKGRS